MSRHLSRLQAMLLGLAVCGGLGLAAYTLFTVGNRNGLGRDAFTVRAGFADVGGVEIGSRVRIQGMDAGEVDAIEPPVSAGDPVKVRLRLAGKYRHLVRTDARVQIISDGLLGGKLIKVLPGRGDEPVEDGAELAGAPTFDLNDGLAEAAGKLNRILGDLDSTLADFRQGQGTAGSVSQDLAKSAARLHTVLAKVDSTIDGLEKGQGTLGQLLKDDTLYKDLTETVAQVKEAMYEVRSGEGTLGKLVKNNEVYAEALGSLQDVRKMVASVKQNADAIKSLPIVRSYVVDAHKELVRPDRKRLRKWYAEADLFEPGKAVLTFDGKVRLNQAGQWLKEQKESGSELLIAAFAGGKQDPDFAQTLTQKQAEVVMEYLKANQKVHRTGFWWWSTRTIKAVGVGLNPPPIPETESLPAARVELLVFVPQNK